MLTLARWAVRSTSRARSFSTEAQLRPDMPGSNPTLSRISVLRRCGTAAMRDTTVSRVGIVGSCRRQGDRVRIGLKRSGMSAPPNPDSPGITSIAFGSGWN